MVDTTDNIILKPIDESEFSKVFSVTKRCLKNFIEPVFGWDDDFQYQRLVTDYQLNWYYWLTYKNRRIGLTCFKPYESAFHIHLLIIFPEYQGQGFGYQFVKQIHRVAKDEQRRFITLSSFKSNKRAIGFYTELGYKVIDDKDENFVNMACEIAS